MLMMLMMMMMMLMMMCDGVCQIRQVRESLDELWSAGDVVLFTWMNLLQNDIINTLSVSSPLSVTADTLTAVIDHDTAVYKQVTRR